MDFRIIRNIDQLNKLLTEAGVETRRYPGKPLTDEQKCTRLFHYTKLETFCKYIWPNKNLRSGEICNLNDLFERYKKVSTELWSQAALLHAFEVMRNQFRQISFTMDFDSFKEGCMSPLMWAYYADSTNGVCIEFDPNKIHFDSDDICKPVNYVDGPSREINIPKDVKSLNDLKSFIHNNVDLIFFTKSSDWEKENEFKILTKNEFTYFDVEAITCVYVASYDSETCLTVEKLVSDQVPVKYFHLDKNSLPQVSDTKICREQMIKAKENPQNFLSRIQQKAEETYIRFKDNPDADLTINVCD